MARVSPGADVESDRAAVVMRGVPLLAGSRAVRERDDLSRRMLKRHFGFLYAAVSEQELGRTAPQRP